MTIKDRNLSSLQGATMSGPSSLLDSLGRICAGSDEHEIAVNALDTLRETIPGEYYSAVCCNLKTLVSELFHPGEGWLAASDPIIQAIKAHHSEHPFSRDFLSSLKPSCYLRSKMVSSREWKRTQIYNEVDRCFGIEDMVAIYQLTSLGNLLILTCGRRHRFAPEDMGPVATLHRILGVLLRPQGGRSAEPPVTVASPAPGRNLTCREREILHWVREGKRNSEIAIILNRSHHTVRKHLENIFSKLGVETRSGAVRSFEEAA